MNKAIVNQYIPDYVSPPGETLLETIEELGISQDDLAKRITITKKQVDDIIAGEAPITTELALKLEQVLGIPAIFWKNRERNYRDALARRALLGLNYSTTLTTMTPEYKKPTPRSEQKALPTKVIQAHQVQHEVQNDISPDQKMIHTIKNLKDGLLRNYEIRELVNQAKDLGEFLKKIDLKTNQIRKFLDAVNRLKVELAQDKDQRFTVIETEVVLLKPKLAYATARKEDDRKTNPVKPLSDVLSEAIDKVKDSPDFYRLVDLIESIIAYHKAAEVKK